MELQSKTQSKKTISNVSIPYSIIMNLIMPDISIMIELVDFYDIDIRDLLRGERKSEKMEENLKETLEMVAEYTEADKAKILKKYTFAVSAH